MLNYQLKRLELKHSSDKKPVLRLRVFYGWCKTGKIRKREGISVIYENAAGVADHHRMNRSFRSAQHNVCWRYQTEGEAREAQHNVCWRYQTEGEAREAQQLNRVFTEYCIFMDDKHIGGSLDRALKANSDADCKNVSQAERARIANELRRWYISEHPDYSEPIRQLEFQFE